MEESEVQQDRAECGQVHQKLAAFLKQHHGEIATAWAELVHASPGSSFASLSPEDAGYLTLRGLEAMSDSLETGSRTVLEAYLVEICPARSELAADLPSVVEALMLCKDAALPVVRGAFGPDSDQTWALVSELETFLRGMVGQLTGMCTAEMTQQLQQERARVAMLLDIAEAASSTLELDEVVRLVAEEIAAALVVDGCTFHLVDEEHRSAVQLLQPSDWSSRVLRPLDSYQSYFHEVLTSRRPVTSYDVQSDPRFPLETSRKLRAKSAVGVPLMVKGKVVAVAWAYTVQDHHRFTPEEVALAQGIGNLLGLIIQNAEVYEQSRLLAVLEERTRLAREIHDGLAQTLGALQLKASQIEESIPAGQVVETEAHLSDLQEMISRAYRDLREAMLGLRAAVEPGTGLVSALREYVTHYQAQYGLEVALEASDDEPATLDGETKAQAMRVVQEALSNVRRHAGARRATLGIKRDGDSVRICVADEGRGFDPSLFEGSDDMRHLGLRTMRERAESVGGTLTVNSQPGHGTRLVLELPVGGDGVGA